MLRIDELISIKDSRGALRHEPEKIFTQFRAALDLLPATVLQDLGHFSRECVNDITRTLCADHLSSVLLVNPEGSLHIARSSALMFELIFNFLFESGQLVLF